jgi:hypothetical protein
LGSLRKNSKWTRLCTAWWQDKRQSTTTLTLNLYLVCLCLCLCVCVVCVCVRNCAFVRLCNDAMMWLCGLLTLTVIQFSHYSI